MNSYVIEKLKEGRANAKLKQNEVAKKIGIKGNTLSNYENGVSEPDIDTFCALCDIYNIDPSNILNEAYGLGMQGQDFKIKPSEIEYIKKYRFISEHSADYANIIDSVLDKGYSMAKQISAQKKHIQEQQEHINQLEQRITAQLVSRIVLPLYRKFASAGSGEYLFDDIPTETIEVADTPAARKADFVIGVSGKSMEPGFYDGDNVFVEKTAELNIGDVGIFVKGNECFIKELGVDRLISRNKVYDDIAGDENVRLVGKVIGKVEM